jgi:hypothetical protein
MADFAARRRSRPPAWPDRVERPSGDAEQRRARDMRPDDGVQAKRLVKRSTGIGAYATGLQIELGMGSSANCHSSQTVP